MYGENISLFHVLVFLHRICSSTLYQLLFNLTVPAIIMALILSFRGQSLIK